MVRQNTYETVFLYIYMDDMCCIREQNTISNAINKIKKIYNIKRIGELTEFIGVHIKNTNEGIFLSQGDTVTKLENVFGKYINKMKIYNIPAATNDTVLCPNKQDILRNEEEQSTY